MEKSQLDVEKSSIEKRKDAEFRLLLKLRTQNLPEFLIRSIIGDVKEIVRYSLEEHVPPEGLGKCTEVFTGLDTRWKQNQRIRQNENFIEPKKILLDSKFRKGSQPVFDVNRKIVKCQDSFFYISILDVIIDFLRKPENRRLLTQKKSDDPNILRSFLDGLLAKKNELFKLHPDCLQIHVYYDDINLFDTASANPVKMAMFYFMIGNLSPAVQSALKYIFLAFAVEESLLNEYPLDCIMSPLIDDLKKLENGIKIDDEKEIHGALTAFKADNQASHRVGAFKRGFTAEHCCRYCMMPFKMIQIATREIESYLRTVEQYDEQVKKLKACSTKEEFKKLSQAFGLNGDSPLNDLQFSHATNVLPPDFFHDIIEHGSLERTLHLILIRFLTGENKVLTLSEFNSKVLEFDFGYSETKPTKIKTGHLDKTNKLHQTGAQLWSLALITPLILGPLVDVDDEYWINYTLILEITSIIAGYEVSMETLGFLEFEIDSYLETFQKLYRITLTPKQHFLIHYIRLILMYGPLYQYNTFRQEAKHQFFKQAIKKIRNLKNPSMTLAQHHQIHLLSCTDESDGDSQDVGEVEKTSRSNLPFSHLIPLDAEEICTVTWIKNDGVKYIPGKCFVMINYEDRMPKFGLLSAIIYVKGEIKLVYRHAETLHFDFHLNAYCIDVTDKYESTCLDHLRAPAVYHAHRVRGHDFIIVKRAVSDLY